MLAIPRREADPGTKYFKPLSCALRVREGILNFTHPGGLLRYWNAPKTQQRVKALPESWQRKLWQYFENHLDFLNGTGPEGIKRNES